MRNIQRRGLRLASVLIASGLAMSASPAVYADDDSGPITLTESQAEKLSQHLTPDVYGDGRDLGDPRQAAEDAKEAAESAATDDAGTTADTGDASTTATSKWKLTKKSAVEGAQGTAATFQVGGSKGDYFSVNSLSPIQRVGADGKPLWSRDATSLDRDWQITPLPRGSKDPYPPAVVMGYNAISPFTVATADGVDTGDLTGDGVDDIVFTAENGVLPYRPFTSPGSSLPNGTFVTVLDGATGKTLWSKLYAAAYNVKIVDKTLVVADSAFYNLNSPADAKSTLNGVRFDYADGKLTPKNTWTYDAGTLTGVQWGALESLGDGLLAASWNQNSRYTSDGTPSGTTLVVDTKDGGLKWVKSGGLYSRQLGYDAARDRVVAIEQTDFAEGAKYELATYELADGTRTTRSERINAVPLALEVADIQGGAEPEYTVSESTLTQDAGSSFPAMNSNSVRALNGDDASQLWARTLKRSGESGDADVAWGIEAVDGRIVASYVNGADSRTAENRGAQRYARIAALSGDKGTVRWEKSGLVGSMFYAQPFAKDKGWRVRTVDANQNVRVYNVGSGKQESLQPLEGTPSSAAATDINGDKKNDVVLGGSSNGLFAYDGPSMVDGKPKRLWAATLPGRVAQVTKADTTGDGRDELIVAATSAAAVVDARTGKVLTTIGAGDGEYVRNVVAADLDGDGKAEVAVATDKVRAYEGDGSLKWEYAVPSEIGTPAFADLSAADGKVYAQFQTRGKNPGQPVAAGGVGLDGKDGKALWSFTPKAPALSQGAILGVPLRAGTFASPGIPYADGHAVVFTYIVRGNADQTPPNQLTNMVQIRDGRTGELLHEAPAGGYSTLSNWMTGPEGLVENSLASLRTYGADGADGRARAIAEIRGGSFATGPNGDRILVRSGDTFVALYDPAALKGDPQGHQAADSGIDILGARENFVADLDGDGKDEIVALAFDRYLADRTAGLVDNEDSTGGYTAIRAAVTLTIDKA
ncbi:FG-GAP-like repeat-containing protein [Streptomyces sp. BYX5S]